ncbi:MAG: zinc ribbon domain-containing protein [Anaerovoracaceae bacterium]|jgi:hypothetical protein
MFCKNCGHVLSEADKFCPNCGARVVLSEDDAAAAASTTDESQDSEQGLSRAEMVKKNFKIEHINWDLEGFPKPEKKPEVPPKEEPVEFDWNAILKKREEEREEVPSARKEEEFNWTPPQTPVRPAPQMQEEESKVIPEAEQPGSEEAASDLTAAPEAVSEETPEAEQPENAPAPEAAAESEKPEEPEVLSAEEVAGVEAATGMPKVTEPEEPETAEAAPEASEAEEPAEEPEHPEFRDPDLIPDNQSAVEDKELQDLIYPDGKPENAAPVDKFYTYSRKNEEFQSLLDQEYKRLKDKMEETQTTDVQEEAEEKLKTREKPRAAFDLSDLEEPAAKAEQTEPQQPSEPRAFAFGNAEPEAEAAEQPEAAAPQEAAVPPEAAAPQETPEEPAAAFSSAGIEDKETSELIEETKKTMSKPSDAENAEWLQQQLNEIRSEYDSKAKAAQAAVGTASFSQVAETASGEPKAVDFASAFTPNGYNAFDTADAASAAAAEAEEVVVLPEEEAAPEPAEAESDVDIDKILAEVTADNNLGTTRYSESGRAAVPSQAQPASRSDENENLSFNDVFSEEEEPAEKPKKHTGLKVAAIILCILIVLEICIICIRQFAPDSAIGTQILSIYNSIFGGITGYIIS